MKSEVTGQPAAIEVREEQEIQSSSKLRRRSAVETWLFSLPAYAFQLVWGWYPLIFAILLSLTDGQVMRPAQFTGLESYVRMWKDPLTALSFRVTLIYTGLSIALTFLIPIFVAILLMEMPRKVMGWMMLLWFLPISPIASTILWKYAYNTQYGLFQYIAVHILHLPPQQFLNDPNQVLFWLVFPGLLLFAPGLIYMATVQGIPESYYEAAEIEGASLWRKIWTISLPRLRPVVALFLLLAVTGALQEFSWPQIMTNGEPGGASLTVVMYIYNLITNSRISDATALSIMLFIILMVVIILMRTLIKEDPDAA